MQLYTIAGLTIGCYEKCLNRITGFSVFSQEWDEKGPDVIIELNKILESKNHTPSYYFQLNENQCEFTHIDDVFFYRMIQPDGNNLLMEMRLIEDKMYVTTNMNVHTPSHLLRFAVWLAFGIYSVSRHTVAVHSSTVIYKDKAILFLGESGTGKSTHTRLWLKHIPDTELLNDDSPFVFADKKNAVAFGSPWSGKTPCFKNKHVPIAGIVRLSKAPCNKIVKLSKISAVGALLPSCPPAFAYDEYLSDRICDILSLLIQQVPVYSLECVPDESAAKLVFSTLKNEGYL